MHIVPLLANIFGLILQAQVIRGNGDTTPQYGVAMTATGCSGIEGFFVAVVFFTDPAVTSLMAQLYQEYHQKYVEEFSMVSEKEELLPIESSTYFTFTCSNQSSNHQNSYYNHQISASIDPNISKKAIPMRRIDIIASNSNGGYPGHSISSVKPALIRNGSSSSNSHQEFATVPPSSDNNTPTTIKKLYIPYKHPRLAICINYLMKCFDTKNKTQEEQTHKIIRGKSEISGSSSSTMVAVINFEKDEEHQIATSEYYEETNPTHIHTEHF
jgi:hypothetical protein